MAHEQHVSVYPVKEILTDMFYRLKVYLVRKPLMQGTGAWHLFIKLPVILVLSLGEKQKHVFYLPLTCGERL